METPKPIPQNITIDKQQGYLEITWQGDGRICRYPLGQLREACPCVVCRGGHQFMGAAYDPANLLELKPKRSYTLVNAQMIGNYALQPIWDDGHETGIYTWDYLWRLCPQS